MTLSVLTRVIGTVILIDLTVHTCGSLWTVTLVGVNQVDAAASVLTGVAVALLDRDVADGARVSRIALAGEGGDAVPAHAVVTRRRHAVVDVLLAEQTGEAFGTFTVISVGPVNTLGSI